jgi:hypothetical protein
MNKRFCDICFSIIESDGSRHLEVVREKDKPVFLWFTIRDEYVDHIDLCSKCWEKLFGLVKPILEKKLDVSIDDIHKNSI